ncbi:MAG: hypothetical protein AVDCRST_MAG18-4248, partial [uncultured Thermomicrobiales bacterium]
GAGAAIRHIPKGSRDSSSGRVADAVADRAARGGRVAARPDDDRDQSALLDRAADPDRADGGAVPGGGERAGGGAGARAGAGDLLPAAGARPDLGRGGDCLRAVRGGEGDGEFGTVAGLARVEWRDLRREDPGGGPARAALLDRRGGDVPDQSAGADRGGGGAAAAGRSVAGAAGAGAGGGNLHRDDRQPRLVARADVQYRAADQRAGAGPPHGIAGDPGVPAAARRHGRIGRGGRRGLRARRAADRGGGADLAARGGAGGAV